MSEEIRKKIEEYARDKTFNLDFSEFKQIVTHCEFAYQLAQEELNKAFREGVEQGYRQATSKEPYNEPTQDELWEELSNACVYNDGYFDNEEAKKRYRITRI